MGVLFPLLPFGLSSPAREEVSPLTLKYCYPLPAGFPRNRSPLKGNPPFRGKPSALGYEGVRGRRLHGAAMLCRLQCARFAKRVAHCRRTVRQPSALIRSPPTFKRRQAACESLAGRLHSERDNIVSCDVPFGVFVIPSSKEKHRTRGRSKQVHVIAAPKERLSCSKTLYQAVRQYTRNRNALKPTGTGSSRGPRPRGTGAQMFKLGRVRPSLNIFTPSPFVSELYAHSCNTRKVSSCSGTPYQTLMV